jgi:hypothetical protein
MAAANGSNGTPEVPAKDPRELRYRKSYFPNADEVAFSTSRKGFVPLPILLRKLVRHLSTPEFRILVYLQLRAGRYGVCYPTPQEMVYELGLGSSKNLTPHLHSLEEKNLISSKTVSGKTYYLIHDPRVAILQMVHTGVIRDEELESVNDLCLDLGQPLIGEDWRDSRPKSASRDTTQPESIQVEED